MLLYFPFRSWERVQSLYTGWIQCLLPSLQACVLLHTATAPPLLHSGWSNAPSFSVWDFGFDPLNFLLVSIVYSSGLYGWTNLLFALRSIVDLYYPFLPLLISLIPPLISAVD
jgi:hypothetical protein